MELAKVEVDEEINARIENSICEDLEVQESKGTFSLFGRGDGKWWVQREAELGGFVGFMNFGFYSNDNGKLSKGFKKDLYFWKIILAAVEDGM